MDKTSCADNKSNCVLRNLTIYQIAYLLCLSNHFVIQGLPIQAESFV